MCQGQKCTDPICFKFIPKKVAENILSTLGEFFTKDRIAPKIKQLRYKYRKALDFGKQSGDGRPNRRYVLRSKYGEDCEPLSHLNLG